MIFLTNSSSPPSAMISVTPPVFTELGGGRREFLELTPCGEQHGRHRLAANPVSASGANKQTPLPRKRGGNVPSEVNTRAAKGGKRREKSHLCLQLVGEKRRVAHAEVVHHFCLLLQGVHQQRLLGDFDH